jgi:hypothetical protein
MATSRSLVFTESKADFEGVGFMLVALFCGIRTKSDNNIEVDVTATFQPRQASSKWQQPVRHFQLSKSTTVSNPAPLHRRQSTAALLFDFDIDTPKDTPCHGQ